MVPIFKGTVVNGKPVLEQRSRFKAWCRRFEGKEFELVLRRPRKDRSSRQSRYYFGAVVRAFSEYTGLEVDEAHEALKQRFLLTEREGYSFVRSTTSLDTVEMTDFIERCRRWLAIEFQINVPDPAEVEP